MGNAARTGSRQAAIVVAAAVLTLVAATAAGASKQTAQKTQMTSVSNSLAALGTAPYALIGLDRAGRAKAVPTLKAVGGVELSHRLAIWRVLGAKAKAILPGLQQAGLVRSYQPDRILYPNSSPFDGADQLLPLEWWLGAVGVDDAPEPPGPGKPVTVIDTGVDLSHLEFATRKNLTPLNRQVVGDSATEAHGTGVTSVLGSPADGIGLVGIYPQADLYVWDATLSDQFTISSIIGGLDRAARLGPGVVNMSLGGELREPLEEEVILDAYDRGVIVVAAAGNSYEEGSPNTFPANFSHVVTVGATDIDDESAFFSTESRGIDISAPGHMLHVAKPGNTYGVAAGTSVSAPLVSGAAAWLWTARPELEKTQVVELLRSTARDIDIKGRDTNTGFGVLNIAAALAAPAPPVDPSEPNDDIDQIVASGMFGHAKPSLVGKSGSGATLTARLDTNEDPKDVYRIWVKRGRRVTATLTGGKLDLATKLSLELWQPDTETTSGQGWHRRNYLAGAATWKAAGPTAVATVNDGMGGAYYYVGVAMPTTALLGSATYDLAVKTAAAPKRPATATKKKKK